MPTVYLTDGVADRREIETETVELRGSVLSVEPAEGERLLVPLERLAGIEGGTVDRHVDSTPTRGGQYTELVTTVEN